LADAPAHSTLGHRKSLCTSSAACSFSATRNAARMAQRASSSVSDSGGRK
jgi:hypothetical protein